MSGFPTLTALVLLPTAGAVAALLVRSDRAARWVAVAFSVVVFLVSLGLPLAFDSSATEMQFSERAAWMPTLGISYHLGIDGISLLLILLTTFLTVLAVVSSWTAVKERVRFYFASLLFLEATMIGTFAALDLVLFFLFWEAMLVPMALLIGVWGGPRRIYAAVKFFLYTMAGSALMLVGIIVMYVLHKSQFGYPSADYFDLLGVFTPRGMQMWLFSAFAISFAVKVPLFPFHTWLPDAHVEAPTAGSVILAGVLLKMGVYGFVRFAIPLFPDGAVALWPYLVALSVVGIIYGAAMAMIQKDVKSLVAYSSVAHLGFVMLGLFAFTFAGMQGGLLQGINHGLTTGALFLLVGMIYERRHTRLISDFGGVAKVMPWFTGLFLTITLASIGLPGTNGFVGEFLALIGMFQRSPFTAVFGVLGIVLAAVYMLWMVKRVFFGPLDKDENRALSDVNRREALVMLPVIVLVFWIGLFPNTFLRPMEPASRAVLARVEAACERARSQEYVEQRGYEEEVQQ